MVKAELFKSCYCSVREGVWDNGLNLVSGIMCVTQTL